MLVKLEETQVILAKQGLKINIKRIIITLNFGAVQNEQKLDYMEPLQGHETHRGRKLFPDTHAFFQPNKIILEVFLGPLKCVLDLARTLVLHSLTVQSKEEVTNR